jgi:hypothetical protein
MTSFFGGADMSEFEAAFSATHHALLFAWLAREAVNLAGEEAGEVAVRHAVRCYGWERGQRMAARCRANGHALTMTNFFAYGEWRVEPGQMYSERSQDGADIRVVTSQCPWHQAWESNEVLPWGRLYCLEIDEAVLAGFSPDLSMAVNSTLSNGGAYCEFLFQGATLNLRNVLLLLYRRSVNPGGRAVMPWSYHTGHLYSTVADVLVDELGPLGRRAVASAMAEFADRYGDVAARTVEAYRDTDFRLLPERATP